MTAQIPTYDRMMRPLHQAMLDLGGSGTIEEITNRVAEIMSIPEDLLLVLHDPDRGGQTEFEYRLAWSRTYLKKFGILENSSRGVWALTSKGREIQNFDEKEVVRFVKEQSKRESSLLEVDGNSTKDNELDISDWKEELHSILLSLAPDAFERLAQRILRESGFVQVEVTGKTGDGGIDGKGIMRLGGLLSFHVFFQCKRYKGSISPSQVRDFRGAMTGRADKGLIITTGSFTKDAIMEATRDGAPPIDLIDGEQLIELLRSLKLGMKINIVEKEEIIINKQWYEGI